MFPLLALLAFAASSKGGAAKQAARKPQSPQSRVQSAVHDVESGIKTAESVVSAISDVFSAL